MRMISKQFAGVLVATLLAVTGCSVQGPSYEPAQDHNKLASSEFIHFVSQAPMVTYDQMCRVSLLLADGDDKPLSFEERDSAAKSRGIARPEWKYAANDVVNRGTVAYMLANASSVPKGLNSTLAGWTGIGCERYALKDLAFEGIMPYGLDYRVPTGGEVMQVMTAADDYMARRGLYARTTKEIDSPKDIE